MSALWPTTRRHRRLLALILLLGAGLRLWLLWRTPIHQPANDEVEYLTVARDLLAGRGWRFYDTYHWLRAPLYPLWLAFSLWLARGNLAYAALPNIALSTVSIWLYYLLGREVGRSGAAHNNSVQPDRAERAGLLAAAAAAVLFTFATFASLWMAETLFTALFVGALIALLRVGERPRLRLIGLAGVLLGLAILTRSLPLTALPFAAAWVAGVRWWRRGNTEQRERPDFRAGLRAALIFGAAAALVIAPWSARNYLAYNALIPVETGLSYNLWAFNEPREDEQTIFRTLAAIPNPADRADFATQKGLARLREDPLILARKVWPNWTALWRVKPIEDRFLQRTYYEDVPVGVFAAGLVLDDALLYVIVLGAILGLIAAPLDRRKALLGGWLLYVIAIVLLTHGEGRYRHFIFPVLLPYAAWFFVQPRVFVQRLAVWRAIALLIALALLWTPLAQQYPWAWAARNLGRGWAVQRAEWAAQRGDTQAAIDLYEQAAAIDPQSADVWLLRGVFEQRIGQPEGALAAFEQAFARKSLYVATNVRRGDALRRLGRADEAREVFKGFYTDPVDMLEWAWTNLDTPPPSAIDVGDGLDFGFVQGMYAPERQSGRLTRWTRGAAALRLAGNSAPTTIRLTLAAPRPDRATVPVTVCVNQRICQQFTLDAQWRTYTIAVPAAPMYAVTINAPTFSPQTIDPQSQDDRGLGVLVDGAVVAGAVSTGRSISPDRADPHGITRGARNVRLHGAPERVTIDRTNLRWGATNSYADFNR